jgi:hypothetical protein
MGFNSGFKGLNYTVEDKSNAMHNEIHLQYWERFTLAYQQVSFQMYVSPCWVPTGRQSGTWIDLFANTSVSLPANHYDTNALYSYKV